MNFRMTRILNIVGIFQPYDWIAIHESTKKCSQAVAIVAHWKRNYCSGSKLRILFLIAVSRA